MNLCRMALVSLLATTLYPSIPAVAQVRNDGRIGRPIASESADPMPGDNPSSGVISGTVRTMDGHVVPDATIEVTDSQRGLRVITGHSDSHGSFALYNIPVGEYEVTASHGVSGAHERVRVDIMSRSANVDFRLPDKTAAEMKSEHDATVSVSQYKVAPKARSLYDKAADAMAHGKLDVARAKVNAALANCPEFAEALTLRGILESAEDKETPAIADFQQAIKYDPNYALTYPALASSLNSAGRFDDAILILGQGERLAPNMWQIYFEYSRAEIGKGDYASSLRHLERASELKGGPQSETPEMHLVRGYALAGNNDTVRATQEIERFLAIEPNSRAANGARKVLDELRAQSVTATK